MHRARYPALGIGGGGAYVDDGQVGITEPAMQLLWRPEQVRGGIAFSGHAVTSLRCPWSRVPVILVFRPQALEIRHYIARWCYNHTGTSAPSIMRESSTDVKRHQRRKRVKLQGKVALVTGASRGIGRA